MGLSVSLTNALSGMNVSQAGLDVLSRNVANAGTPGYHRQTLVTQQGGIGSSSSDARVAGIERAFSEALQRQFTRQISSTAQAEVMADFLGRVELILGKPGDPISLDTVYSGYENALRSLATSPDDYGARADALAKAQVLVETLNRLTGSVQELRQEAEGQIAADVSDLNRMLGSLYEVNQRLIGEGQNLSSRASLLDERDRLVAGIAGMVDLQATYRTDGTVALMTRTGVGLLDGAPSVFSFESAGNLSPNSQFAIDDAANGVGVLSLKTPAGLTLDLVEQGVMQGGELAALVTLRDRTLVDLQSQLDDIAAGLAQAAAAIDTAGTAAASGPASGFDTDISAMRPGDFLTLAYTEAGVHKSVQVVRVDDPAKLPMDYVEADGRRVIGLDFSGGPAAVAAALGGALGPGLAVDNPSGSLLRILDDGAAATTDVGALSMRTTQSALQGGGAALSLFVDQGNADFTNSLDGSTQKLGFAGRVGINTLVTADPRLLVQYESGGTLGDPARAEHLIDRLGTMSFTGTPATLNGLGGYRLKGNASQLIAQTLNFQGSTIGAANSTRQTQLLTLETLTQRTKAEYGVDVDAEMARLMELQNAYAANARVVSVVQELLNALLQV